MKARISHLHNTEQTWQKFAELVPEAGELIIYDPDDKYQYPRLKVGDGKTKLKDLAFFIDTAIDTYMQSVQQDIYIDGGRIR